MNYNHNCKYHNLVKLIQPKHIKVNLIIHQHHNYDMDHDLSIKLKFREGGRSEEKQPKIWKIRVGQRI
jgi:hypothetical protein